MGERRCQNFIGTRKEQKAVLNVLCIFSASAHFVLTLLLIVEDGTLKNILNHFFPLQKGKKKIQFNNLFIFQITVCFFFKKTTHCMLFLLCGYSSCRSCSCCKSYFDLVLKAQPLYPSHVHKHQSNACVMCYIAILLSLNCNALQYFCLTFELLSPK